jgi:DNA ligase-associated metallophosphoesterase
VKIVKFFPYAPMVKITCRDKHDLFKIDRNPVPLLPAMSYTPASIFLDHKRCLLLPEKSLYFPDEKTLVIADLHIGKLGYFRKKGVPLPLSGLLTTLEKLGQLLTSTGPDKVIFLGDLFHTGDEILWQEFLQTLEISADNPHYMLIRGNHDKFGESFYRNAGIDVEPEWTWDNLLFTHEPLEWVKEDCINIAGHIHPMITITGKGKQSLRLPCFLHSGSTFLLPAFGHFTGGKKMTPEEGDIVYAVADSKVIHFEAEY